MRFYCGVGSRKTPPEVLLVMQKLGGLLGDWGWVLRSGGARGADQAFMRGGGPCQLFLPWEGFEGFTAEEATLVEPTELAIRKAPRWHRGWPGLNHAARMLHARNVHEVLGPDCDDPVSFVACWTPGGKRVGGTATAISIANEHDVPVFNFAKPGNLSSMMKYVISVGREA